MSARVSHIDKRLDDVERKVDTLVKVYSAVADDLLRACFVIDEIHRVGRGDPLPWDIATAQVELHHAQRAAAEEKEDESGVPAKQRVEDLKKEIARLRDEYRSMVRGETP